MNLNPTTLSNRYATIELDDSGSKFVSVSTIQPFGLVLTPGSYFVELVAELIGGDTSKVKATAYVFTGNIQTPNEGENWMGSYNSGQLTNGPYFLLSWSDAKYFDAAVWTDSSSNPASQYTVDHFWNSPLHVSSGGGGGGL